MTNTPHDALFKSVFQKPEHASAELRHVLPAEHIAAIDWSTLKLEPGTYVDEALADQHSDLLFSATARTSGERVLVYLLFEHQSTAEPRMALRLLSYMVSIWERFTGDEGNKASPLPLIVPAVLSHVVGGWKAATRFSGLFSPNLGVLADRVLPDFSYVVDDLHRTDDADLKNRVVAEQARLALWLLRDARDGALLLERLVDWVGELEKLARTPGGERALGPLLSYVVRVSSDLQLEQFRAILKERAPAADSITMTIAEQLLAEGEARGVIQGELRRAATSVLTVLEARGLSVSEGVRARIEDCQDLDVLRDWLTRAVTVASAEQIFEG
ncbi:MAG: Rpn family recombination-promoting nuclease/putative transposase [Nannocystaceae bacterium]|nr:Rpn family recombination-promoting nuclease/putative transposase [bacterium]